MELTVKAKSNVSFSNGNIVTLFKWILKLFKINPDKTVVVSFYKTYEMQKIFHSWLQK